MSGLLPGSIGILPPGALGVSLFHHLTAASTRVDGSIRFLERPGSPSIAALKSSGVLRIHGDNEVRALPLSDVLLPDPVTCFQEGRLPETLLVCTNPDQLLGAVTHFVELLEAMAAAGQLAVPRLPFPAVVLCANGIYHQRVRQLLVEKLEEATLYGRLPDLWPDLMPAIVGRWLRGVSIQTGVRDGSGADTVYHPGPSGRTRIVGGSPAIRARVVELCTARGAWFEDAGDAPPTRVEFDKAIVNLAGNLVGLLTAIDDHGEFRPLTVTEIATPANESRLNRLVNEVLRVGRAVKAYGPADTAEALMRELQATMQSHRDHVPSSIQWVAMQLRRGTLQPRLTPTEQWLLEPLIRYARAAHLDDTEIFFSGLERELVGKLQCVIARHAGMN